MNSFGSLLGMLNTSLVEFNTHLIAIRQIHDHFIFIVIFQQLIRCVTSFYTPAVLFLIEYQVHTGILFSFLFNMISVFLSLYGITPIVCLDGFNLACICYWIIAAPEFDSIDYQGVCKARNLINRNDMKSNEYQFVYKFTVNSLVPTQKFVS